MSEPRWTPGPWEASKRDKGLTSSVLSALNMADWGQVIWMPAPPFAMGATGAVVCTANKDPQEAEACAHLIAAAPKLYEALLNMTKWERGVDLQRLPASWPEMIITANAALAEARGEA